jgi:hypothetical protein
VPQVTEDPTCIRDVHNTKEYDCEIHNKRIKDRWEERSFTSKSRTLNLGKLVRLRTTISTVLKITE